MVKRKFTVVTQLHEKNNKDIIEYVNSSRGIYAHIMRKTFHVIKNDENFDKSTYNTYLQNNYNILKRTASSIINDAESRLNALRELKEYERKQLEYKISNLENNIIPKLVKALNDNVLAISKNLDVDLRKHRNLRKQIVAKKNKLNKLKLKLNSLNYQIENNKYKLCFGTKYLLKSDYNKFVARRDSQMSFIGSKSESSCNQMLQLTYNNKNNQFIIKLRKDIGGVKNSIDKYVYGKVYFNHHKSVIKNILKNHNSPLSYKLIFKNNRLYLYCTFEIQNDKSRILTRSTYGTIGLDFNKGFVTISETNEYGHLVKTDKLYYRFKAGNKTKTDLEHIANQVINRGLEVGKDVVIENLNFNKAKANTESKRGKKYNEMIHSLAYRLFVETVESVSYRKLVNVRKVNPAWTSWIARNKYCPEMKLNVHVGASYVIARRGQGYGDSI